MMYQVDEKPETIHVYVVREEEPRPSALPIVLSLLLFVCVLCVFAVGLITYHTPLEHETIRVPAVFLPPASFTASAAILPTGIKTYPAATAQGMLTIYNGSVLAQQLPKGMIFAASSGVEVITVAPAAIPPGDAPLYGVAQVHARALASGEGGNIPAYAVNVVYGDALYIRNMRAFVGGVNTRTVGVITAQDRQTALDTARASLTAQVARRQAILAKPCRELVSGDLRLIVKWTCQFVTYAIPSYMRVTGVRIQGAYLFVDVVFVARPRPFPGK